MNRNPNSMNCQTPFAFLLLCFLMACSQPKDVTNATQVVKDALEAHGLMAQESFDLRFDFRGRNYRAKVASGAFDYYRAFQDSTAQEVVDHLHNEGFTRMIAGDTAVVSPEKANAYGESVNSVIYFALLPYFLKDPAVQTDYLGITTFKNKPYYKIRVTFKEEGGGMDYDDVFVYWFRQDNYALDYLAYSYKRDGGGVRFREAYNAREVNGVRFADYVNYKHPNAEFPVESTDDAFKQGQLEELSRIELQNIALDF